MSQDVVIVGGARTPMAEYVGTPGFGKFKDVSAIDLAAHASTAALERAGVAPESIDHVVVGNALQTSLDAIYGARHVALKAGVAQQTPALTVNRLCGSGIQSVVNAAQLLRGGEATSVLAGGMENMSQAPYVLYGARKGFPFGKAPEMQDMLFASLYDPYADSYMAQTAERIAKRLDIGREAQDEYALRSHQLGSAAVAEGRFAEEIAPVTIPGRRGDVVVDTDDHIKPDTTIEALSGLRAAFGKEGTVTAGNASTLNDGAAAVLVADADLAAEMGWEVIAEIVDQTTSGVAPERVMAAPIPAVRTLLERQELDVLDVDVYEHNEAFAAASCAVAQDLGIPNDRFNLHGGAVSLGHPLGASGARCLITMIGAMRRIDAKSGIVTLCLGGGNAVAMLVRRP